MTKVLKALNDFWASDYAVIFDWQHRFSAEKNDIKRDFIKAFHNVDYIFKDARELGQNNAVDTISGYFVTIPFCSLLATPFSCTARPSWNNQRAKFAMFAGGHRLRDVLDLQAGHDVREVHATNGRVFGERRGDFVAYKHTITLLSSTRTCVSTRSQRSCWRRMPQGPRT